MLNALVKNIGVLTVIAAWIFLVLGGKHRKNYTKNALTIKNAKGLRGIAAIEIMLGHIGIATNNILLFPNRKAGIFFVGIFFMLSGYGLTYAYFNKSNYLNKFFIGRLPKLILPAVIAILFQMAFLDRRLRLDIVYSGSRWYICELLGLYLIFYVAFRFFEKKAELLILFVCILFVVAAFLLGFENTWYGSTLCFPLGIVYYKYRDKIKLKLASRIVTIIAMMIVLSFSSLGFFVLKNSFLSNVIFRSIASCSFCLLILLILEIFDFGNKISWWLGDISYEIYLVHPLVITGMKRFHMESDFLYSLIVIGITIVISLVFHYFLQISQLISVRNEKSNRT